MQHIFHWQNFMGWPQSILEDFFKDYSSPI